MKKIILSVFVLSMAVAVQAQDTPQEKTNKPHHGIEGKKRHHSGMDMKALNLTEDQKAKFKSQRESFRKEMEELKNNQSLSAADRKSKIESIRKEQKAGMDGILTADQKAQLQKMKAEAREKHQAMGKERAEKMKAELGLTDDQSAKLQANRKQMGEKMKAIRENKSLTDEQKKEQIKELMKSQKGKHEVNSYRRTTKENERVSSSQTWWRKKKDRSKTILYLNIIRSLGEPASCFSGRLFFLLVVTP